MTRNILCFTLFRPYRNVFYRARKIDGMTRMRIDFSKDSRALCQRGLSSLPEESIGTETFPRFSSLEDLNEVSKDILAKNGFDRMTEIQAKTWEVATSGKDVIGRARTGTGKTIAFLLSSWNRIVRNANKDKVNILVISPTRELAQQIHLQAEMLTIPHGRDISQVVYGGTSKRRDLDIMHRKIPLLLTSTPGRLVDHLENSEVRGKKFAHFLQDTKILVLDEMDRLLDMGFRNDIKKIISSLPKSRQTLLFSATSPVEVQQMINLCVRPDHVLVDCIKNDDPLSHVSSLTEQSHVVLPQDRLVWGFVQIILKVMSEADHKIVVFLPTAAQTAYFANLFSEGLGRPVLEIHSRLTQSKRNSVSQIFIRARKAVLFTSDVSARGVDYPDVTHVIQYGAANDRETYIHRIGRTGRAGKKGKALIALTEAEKPFLKRDLNGLDIPLDENMQESLQKPLPPNLYDDMTRICREVGIGRAKKIQNDAEKAYRAFMGSYLQSMRNLGIKSLDPLIDTANSFARQAGLSEPPAISSKLASQMGAKRHPGLKVTNSEPTSQYRSTERRGRNF